MSDTHNKLQYGNKYNQWKILDLLLDLNYISFSNPNYTLTRRYEGFVRPSWGFAVVKYALNLVC